MILSISRRTDVPAFYTDWLVNRFNEGYVLVRNPMNHHQVSKVKLSPEVIDCIVFWTKDPKNIISKLENFSEYNYYFQITLNPYGNEIEKNLRKKSEIIKSVKILSDLIGPERIMWRYDPIILTDVYNIDYHEKNFHKLVESLKLYCNKCVISFLNEYSKTKRNMKNIYYKEIKESDMKIIAYKFSKIAEKYKMQLETCSEKIDLSEYGIINGKCIDDKIISKLNNCNVVINKDKNQRSACGCVKSIDIGAYNTCKHNCLYCYANFNEESMLKNIAKHNCYSAFLIGESEIGDTIKEKNSKKFCKKIDQITLDI